MPRRVEGLPGAGSPGGESARGTKGKDVDIRVLRCVVALAECGTFTRAAKRLFVTRQSVSQTLRQAERELGFRVFSREGDVLVTTMAGGAFVDDARKVLDAFDELCERHCRREAKADAAARSPEPLSIALVTGGSMGLPVGIFDAFDPDHSRAMLSIEEMGSDSVVRHVRDGDYEIGLLGSHPDYLEDFESVCLWRPGLWVIVPASHELSGRAELSVGDLDGRRLVTAGLHNHLHRFVIDRCERLGIHPVISATATEGAMIGRLAQEGNALCFGFAPDVYPLPDSVRSVPIRIPDGEEFGTYAIRTGAQARSRSGVARDFWRYLESRAS